MEVGKKVVVLYNGGKGGVTHFAEALVSERASSPPLQRVVTSFPWKDPSGEGKASSEIIHFKDTAGVTQVSLIVLRQEVPTSSCGLIVHEIFDYLLSNAPIQSPDFSIILPSVSRMPGDTRRSKDASLVYTAFVNGASSDGAAGAVDPLPTLPSTFALRDGVLAYMVHYAHATFLPTQLLVGPSAQGGAGPNNDSVEVLSALGEAVGRQTGLTILKQNLEKVGDLASLIDSVEDDWRRLYI